MVNLYESVIINPLGGAFGAARVAGGKALGMDVNPDRMRMEETLPRLLKMKL